MKIIKRNGKEVEFDASKISAAIQAANNEVVETDRLSEEDIDNMTNNVKDRCEKMGRALSVEEIQNLVEDEIMKLNAFEIARKYITYRYKRALVRKANTTDESILSLIRNSNKDLMEENSNMRGVKWS